MFKIFYNIFFASLTMFVFAISPVLEAKKVGDISRSSARNLLNSIDPYHKRDSEVFFQHLASQYKSFALYNLDGLKRDDVATYFINKTLASIEGVNVYPEELLYWDINPAYLIELQLAREDFIAVREAGRIALPEETSNAQAKFDCWVVQATTTLGQEYIDVCKNDFYTSLDFIKENTNKRYITQRDVIIADQKNKTPKVKSVKQNSNAEVVDHIPSTASIGYSPFSWRPERPLTVINQITIPVSTSSNNIDDNSLAKLFSRENTARLPSDNAIDIGSLPISNDVVKPLTDDNIVRVNNSVNKSLLKAINVVGNKVDRIDNKLNIIDKRTATTSDKIKSIDGQFATVNNKVDTINDQISLIDNKVKVIKIDMSEVKETQRTLLTVEEFRQIMDSINSGIIKSTKNMKVKVEDNKPSENIQVLVKHLTTKQAVTEKVLDIYFKFDQDTLDIEYKEAIKELAQLMKNNEEVSLSIVGHTDSKGDRAYNYSLGGRRADVIKKQLVLAGLPGDRIKTVSAGESQLIHTTADGVSNDKNRLGQIIREVKKVE
ncbi:MAG: OmpA family protein [Alphaproteobacteria bacterium]|nr:OmpA family protein [Alphaproteobacteria bacterium]MBL0718123.1 OmpA family protein [Alphaproteobacteria bacterium]